jgi:hypothetical protein
MSTHPTTREQQLERELHHALEKYAEARAAYENLTGLLNARFPPRGDGVHPDFAVEDLLHRDR